MSFTQHQDGATHASVKRLIITAPTKVAQTYTHQSHFHAHAFNSASLLILGVTGGSCFQYITKCGHHTAATGLCHVADKYANELGLVVWVIKDKPTSTKSDWNKTHLAI